MKLLLLNDHYFGEEFDRLGIDTFRIGLTAKNDLQVDPQAQDFSSLLTQIPFKPDAILQIDSIDKRVFFRGIEKVTIPSAFYAIDTPINEFWQKYYAHAFDRVYVDQYVQWRRWMANGCDWIRWLPLAADTTIYYPGENERERDLPVVFIGTVDSKLRPKRSAILFRLKRMAELKIIDGSGRRSETPLKVADYYRHAKIVLNELLFDGINLRTFEAMACGAVVLTQRNRGEERLFQDGRHLLTYTHKDLEDVVQEALENPKLLQEISRESIKQISQNHTIKHRAVKVLADLAKLNIRKKRHQISSRLDAAWGCWQASWKWGNSLNGLREESLRILRDNMEQLDPQRRVVLSASLHDLQSALNTLADLLRENPKNVHARATLASLSLEHGDYHTAKKILANDQLETPEDLHLAIGDLLSQAGLELTPGFNRIQSPMSQWHAFEHYHYAFSRNQNSKDALKRIGKLLEKHGAAEFMVPLWQKFHAAHPTDLESMENLRRSAMLGYYLPMQKLGSAKKRYADRPFLTLRRAEERISTEKHLGGRHR